MAEPGDLPDRVRRPDGRVEAFEPERITRGLFAAAERVGAADPFLSRELTEGVLHFLAGETEGPETTPEQIAEVVGKVVRELGQPAIARAYEERFAAPPAQATPAPAAPAPAPTWLTPASPARDVLHAAAADRLTEFSLTRVYPRDLASAHREGLIRLTDLGTPLELAGLVVSPSVLMHEARNLAGEFLAFDGPEFELATRSGDPEGLAAEYVSELQRDAQATGLTVILNVNVSDPPRLAQGAGPLFGPTAPPTDRRRRIADELARLAADRVHVYWHVSDADRLPPPGRAVEYVFDRPRGPVVLGPGLDRSTPAVLTQVGVNLGRLLDQLGGPPVEADVFLKKVGSLTRFAKTAGHVRQDFLRKHARPGVREAFVLDRARLVLVPVGLGAVAGASDRPPVDFARDILRAMRTAAEADRPRVLPVRVDSPLGDWGGVDLPGPTPRQHLRTAAALHAVTGAGRAVLTPPSDFEVAEGIRAAAESTVHRLAVRPGS